MPANGRWDLRNSAFKGLSLLLILLFHPLHSSFPSSLRLEILNTYFAHMFHTPRLILSSTLAYSNNIRSWVQILTLSLTNLYPFFRYFLRRFVCIHTDSLLRNYDFLEWQANCYTINITALWNPLTCRHWHSSLYNLQTSVSLLYTKYK